MFKIECFAAFFSLAKSSLAAVRDRRNGATVGMVNLRKKIDKMSETSLM